MYFFIFQPTCRIQPNKVTDLNWKDHSRTQPPDLVAFVKQRESNRPKSQPPVGYLRLHLRTTQCPKHCHDLRVVVVSPMAFISHRTAAVCGLVATRFQVQRQCPNVLIPCVEHTGSTHVPIKIQNPKIIATWSLTF